MDVKRGMPGWVLKVERKRDAAVVDMGRCHIRITATPWLEERRSRVKKTRSLNVRHSWVSRTSYNGRLHQRGAKKTKKKREREKGEDDG